ncbi:hypothetical protein GCM10011607_12550 [Shewanella inventionis]|uniref:Uncharacterized protein n=1 Tax=Shewanella inventionis TaxID=1738770 RepID=A0ABQ1IYD9_9GAMM|nr:hypothetical protein [Shewanella inventionis]GGB53478.1 hypothetical protein GCM10011607_12550 [Shewanella inventionis]
MGILNDWMAAFSPSKKSVNFNKQLSLSAACESKLNFANDDVQYLLRTLDVDQVLEYMKKLAKSENFEVFDIHSTTNPKYYYRTESYRSTNRSTESGISGWKQLFNDDFVFTSRKTNGHNPDTNNVPISNAQKNGIFRAFYFYDNLADPVYKVTDSIYACHDMGVAVITRFNVKDPVLKNAPHFMDVTQNLKGCRYLVPKSDELIDSTIQRRNIDFAFLNYWFPLNDERVRNAMNLLINKFPIPSHDEIRSYLSHNEYKNPSNVLSI